MILYTLLFVESRVTPKIGIITSFDSHTSMRIRYNDFSLQEKPYILRRSKAILGTLIASHELNKLGISSSSNNLQVDVSYYIDAKNKRREVPIGLRKGKDQHNKDFWYYITLFSYTSKNGLFILFSLIVIVFGFFSKYPNKRNISIAFHIFTAIFFIIYIFIL